SDGPVASGGAAPLPGTQAPAAGDGPGAPTEVASGGPPPVASTPFDPPGFAGSNPVASAPPTGPVTGRHATAARAPAAYTFTRARMEPVQVNAVDQVPATSGAASESARSADGRHGLFVSFDDHDGAVDAGSEWSSMLRVSNTGVIVERVDLRADGLPA